MDQLSDDEFQVSDVITDGSHMQDGKLRPNVTYLAGEFDYKYETDTNGRIKTWTTNNLQLTSRKDRLKHNPNTPGKKGGDHAGHLAADMFGGSSDIDNLVSQHGKKVNWSGYRKHENEWKKALQADPPKIVEINLSIDYSDDDSRPVKFKLEYFIDGDRYYVEIDN